MIQEGEPFGPFVAARGARIALQVKERASSSWAAKNISASRWIYRVRAYAAGATSSTYNEVLTKGANAATGWLDHYMALGASATAALVWEVVEVDDDNADASTPTGKREVVLMRWSQAVIAAATQ